MHEMQKIRNYKQIRIPFLEHIKINHKAEQLIEIIMGLLSSRRASLDQTLALLGLIHNNAKEPVTSHQLYRLFLHC